MVGLRIGVRGNRASSEKGDPWTVLPPSPILPDPGLEGYPAPRGGGNLRVAPDPPLTPDEFNQEPRSCRTVALASASPCSAASRSRRSRRTRPSPSGWGAGLMTFDTVPGWGLGLDGKPAGRGRPTAGSSSTRTAAIGVSAPRRPDRLLARGQGRPDDPRRRVRRHARHQAPRGGGRRVHLRRPEHQRRGDQVQRPDRRGRPAPPLPHRVGPELQDIKPTAIAVAPDGDDLPEPTATPATSSSSSTRMASTSSTSGPRGTA